MSFADALLALACVSTPAVAVLAGATLAYVVRIAARLAELDDAVGACDSHARRAESLSERAEKSAAAALLLANRTAASRERLEAMASDTAARVASAAGELFDAASSMMDAADALSGGELSADDDDECEDEEAHAS